MRDVIIESHGGEIVVRGGRRILQFSREGNLQPGTLMKSDERWRRVSDKMRLLSEHAQETGDRILVFSLELAEILRSNQPGRAS